MTKFKVIYSLEGNDEKQYNDIVDCKESEIEYAVIKLFPYYVSVNNVNILDYRVIPEEECTFLVFANSKEIYRGLSIKEYETFMSEFLRQFPDNKHLFSKRNRNFCYGKLVEDNLELVFAVTPNKYTDEQIYSIKVLL